MEGKGEEEQRMGRKQEPQQEHMSPMKPVVEDAYGGGLYGKEEGEVYKPRDHPASETQSADGPEEAAVTRPKIEPPPSTGDRDVDITGQSYIQ